MDEEKSDHYCGSAVSAAFPQADRIEKLTQRAVKWATLKAKANADKRLAITIFSFPPDKGNVGTAAYLNVPLRDCSSAVH